MTAATEARVASLDNLVRSAPFEFRAASGADDGLGLMTGHFAVFNQWTRISSWFEGDFYERIAPGAFADVFDRGDPVKVLFDHGFDPTIGNKVLGTPRFMGEDRKGARFDVPLDDTSYNRDLLPGLRGNQYGSSFRFRVAEHSVVDKPKTSKHNPEGLPERTIERIDPLYEFGPVTFPAYVGATAGVRSGSDAFFDRLLRDPASVARLTARLGENSALKMIAEGRSADGHRPDEEETRAADGPGDQQHHGDLQPVPEATTEAYLRLLQRRLAARRPLKESTDG